MNNTRFFFSMFLASLVCLILYSSCSAQTVYPTGCAAAPSDATPVPYQHYVGDAASTAMWCKAGMETDPAFEQRSWVYCDAENGQCAPPSYPTWVDYGAWFATRPRLQLITKGPVPCGNSTFGDPLYGTVKACWYLR